MSRDHSVSRRASLKTIGAAGAALAFCGPAVAARESLPSQATATPAQPADVVDVAVARFGKGHT